MKCIDYDKLCEKIQHPDYTLYSAGDYGAWVDECLNKADVFEAITREQFEEEAIQLITEFVVMNDGHGMSISSEMLLELCFCQLELRLFGMDGDSE